MKTKIICLVLLAVIAACALPGLSYADTVVTEGTPVATTHPVYFYHGTSIVGSVFYFVGDVVALPFRLLGTLFDSIF